ncbi:hypothetical protein NM688_g647 [Phlebia brevispora]|uniref:Uncharacterized protein n=1 Tax=Phlebia brevispora TaxID=194682 RepID=A0ACC1TEI7_9APHY|nr:hypothetical protein NM688_g647 [Phlebia brevispora]
MGEAMGVHDRRHIISVQRGASCPLATSDVFVQQRDRVAAECRNQGSARSSITSQVLRSSHQPLRGDAPEGTAASIMSICMLQSSNLVLGIHQPLTGWWINTTNSMLSFTSNNQHPSQQIVDDHTGMNTGMNDLHHTIEAVVQRIPRNTSISPHGHDHR